MAEKQIDCVYKARYEKAGGHIHVTLFSAPRPDATYANCGSICVGESEFIALQRAWAGVTFEERKP